MDVEDRMIADIAVNRAGSERQNFLTRICADERGSENIGTSERAKPLKRRGMEEAEKIGSSRVIG